MFLLCLTLMVTLGEPQQKVPPPTVIPTPTQTAVPPMPTPRTEPQGEQADVIKPVAEPVTSYRVTSVTIEVQPTWRVVISYVDNRGTPYVDEHFGPCLPPVTPEVPTTENPQCAETLAKQLNTANFSSTSMVKRMLQHLMDEKKIPPAVVTGTPPPPPGALPAPTLKPTGPPMPVKKEPR